MDLYPQNLEPCMSLCSKFQLMSKAEFLKIIKIYITWAFKIEITKDMWVLAQNWPNFKLVMLPRQCHSWKPYCQLSLMPGFQSKCIIFICTVINYFKLLKDIWWEKENVILRL